MNRIPQQYWDNLNHHYPDAMKKFLEWINEYKKTNDWNTLFRGTIAQPAVKFHCIPIAMQCGVMTQFLIERNKMISCITLDGILEVFRLNISYIQYKCNQKNS